MLTTYKDLYIHDLQESIQEKGLNFDCKQFDYFSEEFGNNAMARCLTSLIKSEDIGLALALLEVIRLNISEGEFYFSYESLAEGRNRIWKHLSSHKDARYLGRKIREILTSYTLDIKTRNNSERYCFTFALEILHYLIKTGDTNDYNDFLSFIGQSFKKQEGLIKQVSNLLEIEQVEIATLLLETFQLYILEYADCISIDPIELFCQRIDELEVPIFRYAPPDYYIKIFESVHCYFDLLASSSKYIFMGENDYWQKVLFHTVTNINNGLKYCEGLIFYIVKNLQNDDSYNSDCTNGSKTNMNFLDDFANDKRINWSYDLAHKLYSFFAWQYDSFDALGNTANFRSNEGNHLDKKILKSIFDNKWRNKSVDLKRFAGDMIKLTTLFEDENKMNLQKNERFYQKELLYIVSFLSEESFEELVKEGNFYSADTVLDEWRDEKTEYCLVCQENPCRCSDIDPE